MSPSESRGTLSLLLPVPPDIKQANPTSAAAGGAHLFVVSPSGSVAHETDASEVRYSRTREKLKQLLNDGQLDEREIEIEVTQQAPVMFDMMVPQGAPEGMDNISDMLQEMMPKRKKKRYVKVSEARRILLARRAGKTDQQGRRDRRRTRARPDDGDHLPRRDRQDRRTTRSAIGRSRCLTRGRAA